MRMEWALGTAPSHIASSGLPRFLTDAESEMMTHDRWQVENTARIPVSLGADVRGNLYYNPTAKSPAPAVIWLHPYSYHSGYNEGYGVQGTTVYHRLAQQGYVVLAYDQCGFGLRLLEGRNFYRDYPHWSRLGRMVYDVRSAVDFLAEGRGHAKSARPPIDRKQIYVLGYSVGGMVGLYAAALDERIAGVASFCGFTPLRTDTDAKTTGGIRRLWQWHALQPKLGLFQGREQEIPSDFDDVIAQILSEQRAQAQLHSARRDLLRSGLRLTPAIAPDAWQAADACKATLGLGLPVELYCVNEPLLNAFVAPPQHGRILIGVTNVALENLTTAELRFLIGHELGHAIFEHFVLAPSLIEHDERIAPTQMARLFAWLRYAELTADRVGRVCCGQYTDAVRAFFKLTSGLRSDRFLEHAVESAAQFAELEAESLDSNEEDWFSTHPYGPMRLRALEFFSRSQAFHSLTGQGDGSLTERELERDRSHHAPPGCGDGQLAR